MSGDVVAWVSPLRHGSQVTFLKPNPPEEWDDAFDDWYCYGLVKASDYAALQAKLDAVTKDSERLDFLIEWFGWNDDLEGSGIRDWIDYADARAAIDAALTDQGRAGEGRGG